MDVQEAGANFGIIASKQGFQSGAYQGVTLTTVKLYTFEQLQKIFAKEWAHQNLAPISAFYNRLVDEYRTFEFGTLERDFFEKTLFNDRLKSLRDDLWASTAFPLSLYKDYFSPDPMSDYPDVCYTFPVPNSDGTPRIVSFHDARSMSVQLKSLFEDALMKWQEYREIFSDEYRHLIETGQKTFFDNE